MDGVRGGEGHYYRLAPVLTFLPALFLGACSDTELAAPQNFANDPEVCEESAAPSNYSVSQDSSCTAEPTVGSFEPVIEWQWQEHPLYEGSNDVLAAPAVANLTDDDGDGDVDADDIPDIVFTSFQGGQGDNQAALNAISGDGSGMHWSIAEADGHLVAYAGCVAIGDLDGDGSKEVCTGGTTVALVCLNGADGSVRWTGGTETSAAGCPAIADMDGDGRAEVVFGRQILDWQGELLAVGDGGEGGTYHTSFPIDWDGDGTLEVVAGNTIYELDGSVLWQDDGDDGFPAVGDFDGDGLPDMVRTGHGAVELILNDGTLAWSVALPGGGNGGPPTVADFDGDGDPEVGVAGYSLYTVLDTNGGVLWSKEASDASSSRTGSSVFDFEGDGTAEVVYADEHSLWILDGATGAVLMEETGHASSTLIEYPLIVDVDNDGSTEIVLPSSDASSPGWHGITVIGDASDSWAPARPVWNQYAYHITNVENDGSIPREQEENWAVWNSFRAGGSELGAAHWRADLRLGEPIACLEECDAGAVRLYVPVENGGLAEARGVEVAVLAGETEVARETLSRVDAGEAGWTEEITIDLASWGSGDLVLRVDPDDAVEECDVGNNDWSLGAWPCP